MSTQRSVCRYCGSLIEQEPDAGWFAPSPDDDLAWREGCDASPDFDMRHKPVTDTEPSRWDTRLIREYYTGNLHQLHCTSCGCHVDFLHVPGSAACQEARRERQTSQGE